MLTEIFGSMGTKRIQLDEVSQSSWLVISLNPKTRIVYANGENLEHSWIGGSVTYLNKAVPPHGVVESRVVILLGGHGG